MHVEIQITQLGGGHHVLTPVTLSSRMGGGGGGGHEDLKVAEFRRKVQWVGEYFKENLQCSSNETMHAVCFTCSNSTISTF